MLLNYLGVRKLSTNKDGGSSALNGFTEAGFNAACLLGSLPYGSDILVVACFASSADKLPIVQSHDNNKYVWLFYFICVTYSHGFKHI